MPVREHSESTHMIKLSEVETLLCRAISVADETSAGDSARQLIQLVGDENAYQLASRNKVSANVAHALVNSFMETTNLGRHWLDAFEEANRRISLYLEELEGVLLSLEKSHIQTIILENGAIASAYSLHPALFSFGDFELLVDSKQLPRLHSTLTAIGYSSDVPVQSMKLPHGRVEYEKQLNGNIHLRFNIQTRLVARALISTDSEPTFDELFSRSRLVRDDPIRILGPEDFAFQLALHSAAHGYVRKPGIRLHLDMDMFVNNQTIDWALFLSHVERLQVRTSVYFSLLIPKQLFGTPIPDFVLERLAPPNWKTRAIRRFITRAGIFNPDQPKFGRITYIIFTLLLYDDWHGIRRAVFPDLAWMQERYQFRSKAWLPYYYFVRLFDLALRRTTT